MEALHQPLSGTSEVRNQFIQPLYDVYHRVTSRRECPVQSDMAWLQLGVDRVVFTSRSGRDFLQTHQPYWDRELSTGAYFESLGSSRRLRMVSEASSLLREQIDQCRTSALTPFTELQKFDVYAGDGHYLEHATHDRQRDEKYWQTGHFFCLNLKSQSLFPLTLADSYGRKKEHDTRALKRLSIAMLRQGSPKGRKVLWVWDKALVDLPFWQDRKASGIYYLSLRKEGMRLDLEKERAIDYSELINQGVLSDHIVTDRRGILVRQITFQNPCDGQVYVYLTSEMTLQPGLLVLLYKMRWDIEKTFDETKTKLQETKSWATSTIAKEMQSHFVAIAHNLLLLQQDRLEEEHNIENVAEIQRKEKRLQAQEEKLQKQNQTLPFVYKAVQRFTQATFKLIRWLRTFWYRPTPLLDALSTLRHLYAKL